MSENTSTTTLPAPAPKRPLLRKSVVIPVLTGLLGLGFGASTAGGTPETVEVVKEVPGPVKTVQAEPEVKTVTETVTQEVTPTSCILALSYADDMFDRTGRFMQDVEILTLAEQDAAVADIAARSEEYMAQRLACRGY